jgi:plastocyanin
LRAGRWSLALLVLPLMAGCGSSAGAITATATPDRGIIISARSVAGDVQPTATPTGGPGTSALPSTSGAPDTAPAASALQPTPPQPTPTINSSQFPYAAPTTLTNSALATAIAPVFATEAAAATEAVPPAIVPVINPPQANVPAAAPASTPTAATSVTVNATDAGFSPATVTVKAGGTVTWVGTGQQVHSVTGVPGVVPIGPGANLTTGGFGPGQSTSLTFTTPGTYTYSSATDCLNGNNNVSFGCTRTYTVVVAP